MPDSPDTCGTEAHSGKKKLRIQKYPDMCGRSFNLWSPSDLGWWLVANSRGDHGFAPATFLEPMDTYHRLEEEEWREVEEDDRK